MQGNRGATAGAATSHADAEATLAALVERLQQLKLELDRATPEPEPAPRGLHAVAPLAAPDAPSRAGRPPAAGDDDHAAKSALAAIVRQAVEQAERDAIDVMEDASRRLGEIRSRTRALLDLSTAAPAEDRPAAEPRSLLRRRAAPAPPAAPEQRVYTGAVMIEVGPFTNVVQLSEFEEALASVPGVEDVYIRTFERRQAHFELHAAEPTELIAELQARAPDALYVIEAAERHMRLDIFKDEQE